MKSRESVEIDPIDHIWEEVLAYTKTIADTVHEPFLILDKDLCVMAANDSFYRTFQVEPKNTERKLVYELGNGQWNIRVLRKLLEDILPRNSFFKGFEVDHDFPLVGHKVIILNARRIYREGTQSKIFPPIILLAMEDVTEMMNVAKRLSDHINDFEAGVAGRTAKLETHIGTLNKEIEELKSKPKKHKK
ncbi:MAG: hypothetical protein PHV42_03070 [Candidatus Pacebacteria bacterium]|nr:hypothetical protein [Candidatus Paceibacterota bacterium]